MKKLQPARSSLGLIGTQLFKSSYVGNPSSSPTETTLIRSLSDLYLPTSLPSRLPLPQHLHISPLRLPPSILPPTQPPLHFPTSHPRRPILSHIQRPQHRRIRHRPRRRLPLRPQRPLSRPQKRRLGSASPDLQTRSKHPAMAPLQRRQRLFDHGPKQQLSTSSIIRRNGDRGRDRERESEHHCQNRPPPQHERPSRRRATPPRRHPAVH